MSAFPTCPSQTAFEAPNSRSASMKSLTQALGACRSSLVLPPHRNYDGNRRSNGKSAFMIVRLLFLISFLCIFASSAVGFYAKEFYQPMNWPLMKQSMAVLVPSLIVFFVSFSILKRRPLKRAPQRTTPQDDALKARIKQLVTSKKPGSRPPEERKAVQDQLARSNDVEAFYLAGWDDFDQNRYLGQAPAGKAFLMPLAAGLNRQISGGRQQNTLPTYQALTKAEQEAVKVIHRCLTGSARDVDAVMKTTQAGKLFEPMYILYRESERFWGLKETYQEETIYERVTASHAKPQNLVDKEDLKDIAMALNSARTIFEVVTGEGKAPSVEDSQSVRAEIEAAEAILLKRAPRLECADWSSARSWFGGRPRLGRIDWPCSNSSGEPMVFLAQIDLARIHDLGGSELLPSEGWLAFFMDLKEMRGTVRHIEGHVLPDITPAPDDLPSVEEWKSWRRLGKGGEPQSEGLFPYHPMQIEKLGIAYDADDDERNIALSAHGKLRKYNLSASKVLEKANAPAEFFGQSLMVFADALRRAAEQKDLVISRQERHLSPEDLESLKETARQFEGICREVSRWAESVPRWHQLSSAETDELKAVFAKVRADDLRQFCRWPVPGSLEDLLTQTYLEMLSADDWVFSKLPLEVRTVLSEDYALPTRGYCHQMFGRGISVQSNAAWEHEGDHMLLQLAYDVEMGWNFGDMGVFQYWISPENLKLRNWSAVELSFECN
ncbi:DUF1963 domain-containing protein [Stappia sp. BW2]|uniref:DUF1963 domain-containing protein n=1 Tax=Stappia sp. BW2 TaxID=2592622 RepID=UPI0013967F6B|nr:DUF1963 domain-containing protein [Stappia sp. BW2]